MCNQHWSDPSYRVTSQEASSFYLHEQISVTSSEETANQDQRTLQKSQSKWAGEWGTASSLPAALITGHHNTHNVYSFAK